MAGLENLPLVVQDKFLLPLLDRKSIIAASNVCVTWKKFFHDFTSRRISNVDSVLRDKLVKCGWILSEHDVERCRCIELYTSFFKFIGNDPMSCRELHSQGDVSTARGPPFYALSQSKLFFTYDDGGGIDGVVNVLDLMKDTMEQFEFDPRQSKRGNGTNGMQVHDKTLAVAEYEAMLKVCIWNHETSQFIHCLNENSFKMAMGLTQEEFHTHKIRVCKIALAEDKLAVFL